RAAFLAAQKNFCIPVAIEEEDYKKLLRPDKLKEIEEIIKKKRIQTLDVPIEHPCFIGLLCSNRTFWFNALSKICLTLFRKEKQLSSAGNILIDIKDMSFFARFFSRMNMQVSKTERSIVDKELETAVNDLLYIKIPVIPNAEYCQKHYSLILSDQTQNTAFAADNIIYFSTQLLNKEKYHFITSGINNGINTYIYLQSKG
ncbi:MAG: hypothetical protein NC392_15445, partial [Roseburia sp.]|nr:hypothetical protein [Roseburia sp.]